MRTRRLEGGASLYALRIVLALAVPMLCMMALLPKVAAAAPTWTQENPGVVAALTGVASPDANHVWAVGNTGTIVATTDAGATWVTEQSGTTYNLNGVAFLDDNHGWAVGGHGAILVTSNGGTTWSSETSGTTQMLDSVAFSDLQHGWAVGASGTIIATTDGGTTWTPQSSGTSDLLSHVAAVGTDDAWAVGSPGIILATTDGGTTWAPQSSGTANNLSCVTFLSAEVGWAVGANGTILSTTNGGTTWTPQNSGGLQTLCAATFTDAGHGWIVGTSTLSNGTILGTADGGASWPAQSSGVLGGLLGVSFPDINHGWAVGYAQYSLLGVILRYHYPAPTVDVPQGGNAWYGGPVDVAVNATVDSSLTLSSLQYSTNGGSTWTDVPGSGMGRTLHISAEGTTNLMVRATDSVGQTATESTTINIDSSTPTIGVSGNDSAWHATPVTLTFTPHVGISGIWSVEYKIGSTDWEPVIPVAGAYTLAVSTNGADTVSYRATDCAELVSQVASCIVKVDAVKPVAKAEAATLKHDAVGQLDLYVTKKPAGCGKAKVTISFTQGGKPKKTFTTALLSVNRWNKVGWKCALAKGTYTMKLLAKDSIGNAQVGPTTAKLVVK